MAINQARCTCGTSAARRTGGFTRTPSSRAASGTSAGAKAPDGVTRRPSGTVADASDRAVSIRTHCRATAAASAPSLLWPPGASEGIFLDVPEGIDLPYRRLPKGYPEAKTQNWFSHSSQQRTALRSPGTPLCGWLRCFGDFSTTTRRLNASAKPPPLAGPLEAAHVTADDNVHGLLERSHQAMLRALAHQEYPYGWIMRDLGWQRGPDRAPLFDVMVAMDLLDAGEAEGERRGGGSRQITFRPVKLPRRSKEADLQFVFIRSPRTLERIGDLGRSLWSSKASRPQTAGRHDDGGRR